MNGWGNFISAYKLVWFRCVGYLLVPTVTLFLSKTEDLTGTQWHQMEGFDRFRLYLLCGLNGFNALMAVIDQSLSRARNEHEKLKQTDLSIEDKSK